VAIRPEARGTCAPVAVPRNLVTPPGNRITRPLPRRAASTHARGPSLSVGQRGIWYFDSALSPSASFFCRYVAQTDRRRSATLAVTDDRDFGKCRSCGERRAPRASSVVHGTAPIEGPSQHTLAPRNCPALRRRGVARRCGAADCPALPRRTNPSFGEGSSRASAPFTCAARFDAAPRASHGSRGHPRRARPGWSITRPICRRRAYEIAFTKGYC
jgi:hypothetical protein